MQEAHPCTTDCHVFRLTLTQPPAEDKNSRDEKGESPESMQNVAHRQIVHVDKMPFGAGTQAHCVAAKMHACSPTSEHP